MRVNARPMTRFLKDWLKSFVFAYTNKVVFFVIGAIFAGGGLAALVSLWHNMSVFISEHIAMTTFFTVSTILVLIVLAFAAWGKKMMADEARKAAEAECARLRARLNAPQTRIAEKFAQLREKALDNAIAAYDDMIKAENRLK